MRGMGGEAMNGEWIWAELDALEVNYHALYEAKRKLEEETIAKRRRLEVQLLAELQRVEDRLRAAGVPIARA